jgi:Chaperone of endosialidase
MPSFEKTSSLCQGNLPQVRIVASSSRNAVSFSSPCTRKRFCGPARHGKLFGPILKEIKPMDRASEAILGFKPVMFQYKSDKTGIPQFGLIAEEVAQVNPDLVVRDKNGEIYTVRYDAVNAMLLNEFLK